jgi:hypothetical protein
MVNRFLNHSSVILLLFFLTSPQPKAMGTSIVDPISLSEQFLSSIAANQSTSSILENYRQMDAEYLRDQLDTEEKKLVFWINTYNGFIQDFLFNDPSLYGDRGAFFSQKRMVIAGKEMSFDDLEHGIIRSSRWKLSLGYIRNPFAAKHIRMWRTKAPDGRVHFALNCGATSCPPVRIYHIGRLDKQMDESARIYLERTTRIEGNSVTVTPLMSWFRGDFGGKKGVIKDFLVPYGIIPEGLDASLSYGDYDWNLELSEILPE